MLPVPVALSHKLPFDRSCAKEAGLAETTPSGEPETFTLETESVIWAIPIA